MVQSKKQGKDMAVINVVLCVFCIFGSSNFHQVGGGGVEGPGLPDSKNLEQRCSAIFAVF